VIKRLCMGLAFGLLVSRFTGAQQVLDDSFYSLLEKALNINIAATISETGEKAVWNIKSSELTIPGRSVTVKLVGSNVVVIAQLTPYVNADNTVLLVAQGQVWISSPLEDKIKYLTTLKSLPIKLGEKVFFFPLGANVEKTSENLYNIALEITIQPYTHDK
jgi:hypothetical protein